MLELHAQQFDEDLPDRRAGSEEEFAAATYITAHLQQAGYVVEFDAVPVANTVRSTNVLALPPSTNDPDHVVAVAYDAGGSAESIATFLEVARALRVAVPDHSVEFAALGAEWAEVEGGNLGTRRLIKLLNDRELDPEIVYLMGREETEPLFEAAGLRHRFAYGDDPEAAEVLLRSLIEKSQ